MAITEVIDGYVGEVERDLPRSLRERENRDGTGEVRFVDMRLERDGNEIDSPTSGEDVDIVLNYESGRKEPFGMVSFGMTVFSLEDSTPLLNLSSETAGAVFRDVPPQGEARCRLHNCPLPAGQYFISIWADRAGEMLDGVHRAFEMTVSGGDFYGSGRQPHPDHRTVLVPHDWSVSEASAPDRNGPRCRWDLQGQDLRVALCHVREGGLARVPLLSGPDPRLAGHRSPIASAICSPSPSAEHSSDTERTTSGGSSVDQPMPVTITGTPAAMQSETAPDAPALNPDRN